MRGIDIKTLVANIRRARERHQWSQAELAKRVGIAQSHISRLERGEKGVSAENLSVIARTLDTALDELMGLLEGPPSTQRDTNYDPRQSIIMDHRSPPDLAALAADTAVTESLGITPAEWLQLATVNLPRTVTKEGYLQLLITLRAISGQSTNPM